MQLSKILSIFRIRYVCKNYMNPLFNAKFYKSKNGSSNSDENLVYELKCAAMFINYTLGFEDNAERNIKYLINKFYTG